MSLGHLYIIMGGFLQKKILDRCGELAITSGCSNERRSSITFSVSDVQVAVSAITLISFLIKLLKVPISAKAILKLFPHVFTNELHPLQGPSNYTCKELTVAFCDILYYLILTLD